MAPLLQRYQTRQVLVGATVVFALLTSILLICDGKYILYGSDLYLRCQRLLAGGHEFGAGTTPWQSSRKLLIL